mmetsp:Transcript_48660/g.130239  ORF Transcript_48660/g.130239 Transcript_48660/m.130239 type:complete len:618 (-) Transcript_48660:37-1890(-)
MAGRSALDYIPAKSLTFKQKPMRGSFGYVDDVDAEVSGLMEEQKKLVKEDEGRWASWHQRQNCDAAEFRAAKAGQKKAADAPVVAGDVLLGEKQREKPKLPSFMSVRGVLKVKAKTASAADTAAADDAPMSDWASVPPSEVFPTTAASSSSAAVPSTKRAKARPMLGKAAQLKLTAHSLKAASGSGASQAAPAPAASGAMAEQDCAAGDAAQRGSDEEGDARLRGGTQAVLPRGRGHAADRSLSCQRAPTRDASGLLSGAAAYDGHRADRSRSREAVGDSSAGGDRAEGAGRGDARGRGGGLSDAWRDGGHRGDGRRHCDREHTHGDDGRERGARRCDSSPARRDDPSRSRSPGRREACLRERDSLGHDRSYGRGSCDRHDSPARDPGCSAHLRPGQSTAGSHDRDDHQQELYGGGREAPGGRGPQHPGSVPAQDTAQGREEPAGDVPLHGDGAVRRLGWDTIRLMARAGNKEELQRRKAMGLKEKKAKRGKKPKRDDSSSGSSSSSSSSVSSSKSEKPKGPKKKKQRKAKKAKPVGITADPPEPFAEAVTVVIDQDSDIEVLDGPECQVVPAGSAQAPQKKDKAKEKKKGKIKDQSLDNILMAIGKRLKKAARKAG